MRGEMVEGTLDQLLDRPLRRRSLEIELALLGPDFLVDPFQDSKVERVLVAEIVIDQLLVDPGPVSDFIDAGAGKPAVGKFTSCGGQQLLPRRFRVAPLWFLRRLLAVCSSFGHFQPNS